MKSDEWALRLKSSYSYGSDFILSKYSYDKIMLCTYQVLYYHKIMHLDIKLRAIKFQTPCIIWGANILLIYFINMLYMYIYMCLYMCVYICFFVYVVNINHIKILTVNNIFCFRKISTN